MQATRRYTILLVSFLFSSITFLSGISSKANAQAITHVPLYTFEGDFNEEFGSTVSGAGDVNGDGYDDVIVGASLDDDNGFNSGSAVVYSGLDGSKLYRFNGDNEIDEFGRTVSGAGDVNNDGYDDVIIGSPNSDFRRGNARVFSGFDGSELYNFQGDIGEDPFRPGGDEFGVSVSGAGDVNGDGFDDVIVGAEDDDNNGFQTGSARVFSGFDGSELYTFNGDTGSAFFGRSVSGAGDVNNDGYDDLIVGAHADDSIVFNGGIARVFSGFDGSELYKFEGSSLGDQLGRSVSGAGDVNGDGYDDLIVGAEGDNNLGFPGPVGGAGSGSAKVFSGFDGSELYVFDGDSNHDLFGISVSGAGDVNGDGLDDLIVGAIFDDNNGTRSGSARVLSGADGSQLYMFDGDVAFRQFGTSVSRAGDINGDGLDDFIVGGVNIAVVYVSQLPDPISLSVTAEAGSRLTQESFNITNHPLSSMTVFQILDSEVFTNPVTIDAEFTDLANAQFNPLYSDSDTSILRSDIIELSGLNGLLHVVQLSVDSAVGLSELVWLTDDGTSQWVNAVLGNSNITGLELDPTVSLNDTLIMVDDVEMTVAAYLDSQRFNGSYDDYLASRGGLEPELGAFGSATGEVWAVIDHNSSFSAAEVSVVVLGDINTDGTVNFLDISSFISVLSAGDLQAEADINQDGSVNFLDISPFITILQGR